MIGMMILTGALSSAAPAAPPQPNAAPSQATAIVTVRNIELGRGPVFVSICAKSQFLTGKCTAQARMIAATEQQSVRVGPFPYGLYAVQVWHDLDADNVFDLNFLGIPSEPTGFSRGAKGNFGPPKFEDAAVTFDKPAVAVTVDIF